MYKRQYLFSGVVVILVLHRLWFGQSCMILSLLFLVFSPGLVFAICLVHMYICCRKLTNVPSIIVGLSVDCVSISFLIHEFHILVLVVTTITLISYFISIAWILILLLCSSLNVYQSYPEVNIGI